jgi:ABC-type multidrug transport system ATPase subunit
MEAELYFFSSGHPAIFPIPSGSMISIGSGPSDDLLVEGLMSGHGRLAWSREEATWVLEAPNGGCEVEGQPMEPEEPSRPLNNGDIITLGQFYLRFVKCPAPPQPSGPGTSAGGHDPEWMALGREALIIGRQSIQAIKSETSEGASRRLNLDADDVRISRTQVVIDWREGRHWITDRGRGPTMLNGMAFNSKKLVTGDRFKILDYVFEYTGTGLLWLGSGKSGTVQARRIAVDVKTSKGPLRILHPVSLVIDPGQFIGILGVSGQGKSTLMNALCGLRPSSEGDVLLDGKKLSDRRAPSGAIGLVPQDDIVHRELTAREAISFAARLRLGLPPALLRELVDDVIVKLGLLAHAEKKVSELSGGQRKRTSIATELLAGPSVLFLDEPSSGLDPYYEGKLMEQLQKLSWTGLTVVCTTHVLYKAHIFDKICVIHDGRMVFMGKADEARQQFFTGDTSSPTINLASFPLERIYSRLMEPPDQAEKWEGQFLKSPLGKALEPQAPPFASDRARRRSASKGIPYCRAFAVLMARQWRILQADWLNLLFLLAQALVIGALVGWVSDNSVFRMFLCLVAALWFGCSNAAQQIIGEMAILSRERVAGLGLNTYIQSKVLFLGVITLLQTAVLFTVTVVSAGVFHPPDDDLDSFSSYRESFARDLRSKRKLEPNAYWKSAIESDNEQSRSWPVTVLALAARYLDLEDNILEPVEALDLVERKKLKIEAPERPKIPLNDLLLTTLGWRAASLALTALTGVMLGLTVSALVRSSTQAVLWVPLILIPQILFGGFVVTLPEMLASVRIFCEAMPSFASQRIMDVSHIYGQKLGDITNKTKIPGFIAADPESVKWEPNSQSESYERFRDHNASWQNLTVSHPTVGQRPKYEEQDPPGSDNLVTPDDVPTRNDVINAAADYRPLHQAEIYQDATPAKLAAGTLLAWMGGCYLVILGGLTLKRPSS